MKPVDAIVSIAAPSSTSRLDAVQTKQLESLGYREVVSNRTGQTLRVDRAFWDEQDADPEAHDLLGLAARIPSPALIINGDSDDVVPEQAALSIADAMPNAESLIIEGGNHVLNTPNPFQIGSEPPKQLSTALSEMTIFLDRVLAAR